MAEGIPTSVPLDGERPPYTVRVRLDSRAANLDAIQNIVFSSAPPAHTATLGSSAQVHSCRRRTKSAAKTCSS